MTRQEFIQNITTWYELLNFCYVYDCSVCSDVISHDSLGEYIAEDFDTFGHEYPWTDIRRWLNNIDDSANYYYRCGSFKYDSVDYDFEDYKYYVLSWCDEAADIFDEEDDDDFLIDGNAFLPGESDIDDCGCSVEEFLGLHSPTIKS